MYPRIILKPGKEESLKRFHPWVFSGAIGSTDLPVRAEKNRSGDPFPCAIEEGSVVEVVSSTGQVLGVGHAQVGSIAVRMLAFGGAVEINREFYRQRLGAALQLRKNLGLLRGGNVFRLVHGEGDFLPGLVIDIYADTAVMQAHSVGMHVDREIIAAALKDVCKDFVKNIYYKSSATLPHNARLDVEDGYIGERTLATNAARCTPNFVSRSVQDKTQNGSGDPFSGLNGSGDPFPNDPFPIAIENGIKFYPDWEEGQKTGFFIDQRENRALVEKYAKGRRVLNMFCYTGGFSLYALRGGADLVHSVDASAKAVELVDRNVELNYRSTDLPVGERSSCSVQIGERTSRSVQDKTQNGSGDPFPDMPRHQSFVADAFEYLNQTTEKYDLIILDPPAFAKHQKVLHQALQGYRKLNAQAFKKIAPGGILFTFSCSQAVSKDDFRRAVFTAAAQSGRRVRILHQLTQPADHPVNIYHPEGEYLKGLVLYVE